MKKNIIYILIAIITSFIAYYYFKYRYVNIPLFTNINKIKIDDGNQLYKIKADLGEYDSVFIFQDYFSYLNTKKTTKLHYHVYVKLDDYFSNHNKTEKFIKNLEYLYYNYYNIFIGFKESEYTIKFIPNINNNIKIDQNLFIINKKHYKISINYARSGLSTYKEVYF